MRFAWFLAEITDGKSFSAPETTRNQLPVPVNGGYYAIAIQWIVNPAALLSGAKKKNGNVN